MGCQAKGRSSRLTDLKTYPLGMMYRCHGKWIRMGLWEQSDIFMVGFTYPRLLLHELDHLELVPITQIGHEQREEKVQDVRLCFISRQWFDREPGVPLYGGTWSNMHPPWFRRTS